MKADHVYAPLNITEVGQPTYQGNDGNTAVTEAEQAQDVKQYLTQAAEWGSPRSTSMRLSTPAKEATAYTSGR